MNGFEFPFDLSILEWVQSNMRNSFLDGFFSGITHLGDAGIFWIILTLALLIFPKTRKIGFCSMIALIIDLIVVNLGVKLIVDRMRPYNFYKDLYDSGKLNLLIEIQKDSSFPSGHTAGSFASAAAIFGYNKKLGIPAIILAAVIAFSRIFVAVHFPSDVFAGVIIGIICAVIAYFITKKLYPVLENKFKKAEA